MRVLIISQNFFPDNFKINEVASGLVNAGHDVTVLTGLGDYSTGKIPTQYRHHKNRNELYQGVKVHRVRTISRRTGPVFRSLNYLSFAINGWFWGKFQRQKFDAVYVYLLSPITMGYPGIAVAHRQKIPLLMYNLDLWPESVKAMHIQEGTIPFKMIHAISRHVYQKADQIAVSSKPFIDYLVEVNQIASDRIFFLPQYANLPKSEQQNPAVRQELEQHDAAINLVFTGNIGLVQDLETVIQAVMVLRDEGVTAKQLKIHLVGDGSDLDSLKKLVESLKLREFVVFYGRRPEEDMSIFYEFADACLLTLKNENKIGVTIPAKLQGYLAAGKPVLAAIDGDAQRVIAEARCGFRVGSGDVAGLAESIKIFMTLSSSERRKFGRNGFDYFLRYFTKKDFMTATEQWLLRNKRKEEF